MPELPLSIGPPRSTSWSTPAHKGATKRLPIDCQTRATASLKWPLLSCEGASLHALGQACQALPPPLYASRYTRQGRTASRAVQRPHKPAAAAGHRVSARAAPAPPPTRCPALGTDPISLVPASTGQHYCIPAAKLAGRSATAPAMPRTALCLALLALLAAPGPVRPAAGERHPPRGSAEQVAMLTSTHLPPMHPCPAERRR